MSLATGDHAGPYVIGATLAAGERVQVYRAHDPEMSREVSLDVLAGEYLRDPAEAEGIDHAVRNATRLRHPNIATVYGAGHSGKDLYVASEFVDGRSVRQLLAHGPLARRRVIDLGTQIAEGLAAAHACGIVHGGLRPENILVSREGQVKIREFGLHPVGDTPPGADIFDAGVVLHEMLTGERAVSAPATPPASELHEVVRRCLAPEPGDRFATAADLARALQDIEDTQSAVARAASVRRSWEWRIVAFALPLAAAIAAGAYWLGSRSSVHEPARFAAVTTAEGHVSSASLYGDSAVYAFTSEGGEPLTYLAVAGGGTRVLDVPKGASIASVSKRGEMAILASSSILGTQLLRAPITGGKPQPVAEAVCDAQWSPDGSAMAVVRFAGDHYRVEYPIGTVLFKAKAPPSGVGVSPDGERVAVFAYENDGYVLYALDRGGGSFRLGRLEGEPSHRARPRWSPNGREIWYSATDAWQEGAIFAVNLQSRRRVVARFPGEISLEDLSPSGKALLARNHSYRRVLLDREGEPARDLSWNNAFAVALSTDGKRIGLTDYSGSREYYVRSTDGGGPARFGTGFISAFSPDGKWMAVIRAGREERVGLVPTVPSGEIPPEFPALERATFLGWMPDSRRFLVAAGPAAARSFYMASLDGGEPRVLPGTPSGEPFFDSSVAPDGRRLWLLGAGKHWIVDIASGRWSNIPHLAPDDIVLGWTSDSRSMFVGAESAAGTLTRIDRVDVESGARKPFKTLPEGIPPGRGALITPDGKTRIYTSVKAVSDLWIAEGLR